MEEILFESLKDGAYALEYPIGYEFSENVKYTTAEFDKLHVRKVRLPEGQNNLIYVLSDTFDGCLKMINSNNFFIPSNYRRIFYPRYFVNRFMTKRFVLNMGKVDINTRDKNIKDKTKFQPYSGRVITGGHENLFYLLGDLYSKTKPIMESFTIKRNYTEFYPEFMKIINALTPEFKPIGKEGCDSRIIIIDTDAFKFKIGADLKLNKTNPLFLLYLAYLKNRDISNLNIDVDMMICSGNMFLKFNPSRLTMDKWDIFRKALFRIMGTNLDDYTDSLSEKDKAELQTTAKDRLITNVVSERLVPFTNNISGSTKAVLQNAVENKVREELTKKAELKKEIMATTKEVQDKIEVKKPNEFEKAIANSDHSTSRLSSAQVNRLKSFDLGYSSLTKNTGMIIDDDYDDEDDFDRPADDDSEIEDETFNAINDEEVAEEVLDDIQEKISPMKDPKKAPINSARDAKLREEQKKVIVGTETIEQILSRDTQNVPIKEEDKSKVLHTSNPNMQTVRFANFDKTYIDELYMKDIVACFDFLKDKESPFYVTSVTIKDTSDSQNLKDTWSVVLKDELGKRHTVKVDIPKFQNDRFMLLGGNRYVILKQNFYNPLVKDTPDTVILTTNYNKITITRKATKSLTSIERIFSLIKKSGDSKMFVSGDSSPGNRKYISTLEYDELSKRIFKFESSRCTLLFSRDYIKDNYQDKIPPIKDNDFYIGHEGDTPIIINEDTGLDKSGRTITEIIENNLPDSYLQIYNSIKGPKLSMYVECKMAGEWVPVILPLMVWDGLKKSLDKMDMKWRFIEDAKKLPKATASANYIRFANGVLEYERKTYTELLMNGLLQLKPETYMFEEFEDESGYGEYVRAKWGSYKGINELKNFDEFLIDPITLQVCKDMLLPSDPAGLMIHAVKLLSDNAYVSKASDKSYRTRSIEMIPSILYGCLARQYKAYVNTGGRIPMTLKQNAVISALQAEKTVEAYSTLNPVVEVSKTFNISTKGYKGSNSTYSYDEEKRSYDPTAVGKLAITTSAKRIGRIKLL